MSPVPASLNTPLLRHMRTICVGLLVACLLALLVGAVLVRTKKAPPPLPPAPSTLSAVPIELPADVGAGSTGELVARPLFWASRTPLSDEPIMKPVARPTGPSALDKAELLGLFSSGETSGAILKVAGARQRLLVGQEVGDWALDTISGNEALFVHKGGAGGQRRLTLQYAEVKAPPEPAAPPEEEVEPDADSESDTDSEPARSRNGQPNE